MRRHLALVVVAASALVAGRQADAGWMFLPSYYSHDPNTGARVAQYAPKETAFAREDPSYQQSGYRHNQTTIRGPGGSADRLHVVETWGEGEAIRPYGEWQRPFRAGATPYGPWGNPQGPWTLPFGAWENPYGLGRIPQVYEYRNSGPLWGGGYPHAQPDGPGGGYGPDRGGHRRDGPHGGPGD